MYVASILSGLMSICCSSCGQLFPLVGAAACGISRLLQDVSEDILMGCHGYHLLMMRREFADDAIGQFGAGSHPLRSIALHSERIVDTLSSLVNYSALTGVVLALCGAARVSLQRRHRADLVCAVSDYAVQFAPPTLYAACTYHLCIS